MQFQKEKQEQIKVTKNQKKYDNLSDYDSYDEKGNNTRNDLDYYLNRSLSEV